MGNHRVIDRGLSGKYLFVPEPGNCSRISDSPFSTVDTSSGTHRMGVLLHEKKSSRSTLNRPHETVVIERLLAVPAICTKETSVGDVEIQARNVASQNVGRGR